MAKKSDQEQNEKKSLSDLKDMQDEIKTAEAGADKKADEKNGDEDDTVTEFPEPTLDEQGRAHGVGRRKDACVARVWVWPGNGKITVNNIDSADYFERPVNRMVINQPFEILDREGQFDVLVNVEGGGKSGQAQAVRHGLSRALTKFDPSTRPALKKAGYLTRDDRIVERKKYGQPKARKKFQWAKR
jgi:small subunit ribosomal protein S9